MIYEITVFMARELQKHDLILISVDEISPIALDTASDLERQSPKRSG